MNSKKITDFDRAKGAENYMYYSGIATFLNCQHDIPTNRILE